MKITFVKDKMTKDVIEKIIEIDKTFYHDFDYSDTSWYFERYNEKNSIYLLKVDDKIVGYFLFYSITKQLFDDVCELKYIGDYDFPSDQINVKSNYFYMPSVLVLEEYRNYSLKLLIALKREIEKKENLVVITVSREGKAIASLVLKEVGQVNSNVFVYKKAYKYTK